MSGGYNNKNDADYYMHQNMMLEQPEIQSELDLHCNQIYESDKRRREIMKETYRKVLHQILNDITEQYNNNCQNYYSSYTTNRNELEDTRSIRVTVPEIVYDDYGAAAYYDLEECCAFLMLSLKNRGYGVNYTKPNILMISWLNFEEINRVKSIKKFLQKEDSKTKKLFKNVRLMNNDEHHELQRLRRKKKKKRQQFDNKYVYNKQQSGRVSQFYDNSGHRSFNNNNDDINSESSDSEILENEQSTDIYLNDRQSKVRVENKKGLRRYFEEQAMENDIDPSHYQSFGMSQADTNARKKKRSQTKNMTYNVDTIDPDDSATQLGEEKFQKLEDWIEKNCDKTSTVSKEHLLTTENLKKHNSSKPKPKPKPKPKQKRQQLDSRSTMSTSSRYGEIMKKSKSKSKYAQLTKKPRSQQKQPSYLRRGRDYGGSNSSMSWEETNVNHQQAGVTYIANPKKFVGVGRNGYSKRRIYQPNPQQV